MSQLSDTALSGNADDFIRPFMIDANGLHGRLVRLGPALDAPLSAHDYPESVAVLLGEALSLVSGLSAGLKFDGVFSLQARGDGPVKLLVDDVTTGGDTSWQTVKTGSSYLSQSELTLTFGLGAAATTSTVRVSWPSGQEEEWRRTPIAQGEPPIPSRGPGVLSSLGSSTLSGD